MLEARANLQTGLLWIYAHSQVKSYDLPVDTLCYIWGPSFICLNWVVNVKTSRSPNRPSLRLQLRQLGLLSHMWDVM